MFAARYALRLILVSFFCLACPALAQNLPPASFADLVEKLSPAVVNISTTQKIKSAQGAVPFGMPFQELPDTPEFEPFREFFDRFNQMQQGPQQPVEREIFSLGSGFIVDAKGFVITNNHVIDSAEEVMVTLSDHTKYKATVVGRDKKTDLALLKVETKKDLPFVALGDSDVIRVGDWVVAIGNPFGLGGTVTQGIISARQRSINAGPFDDFLQTDASINRGNSGGPLFNMKGEVIGINTAIFSPSGGSVGIGFAIPTALVKPVIEQLKQFGRTHRGWMGVKIQEVSEEIAESVGLPKAAGALVLEVNKDGPAAKAGIAPGDIITHFDGKEISEMRFLPRMVAETKIGKTVTLTYWHKNAAKTAQVAIAESQEPADENDDKTPSLSKKHSEKPGTETMLGMVVSPMTPLLRQELHLDSKMDGLVVIEVKHGLEAAKRGLQPGDVIINVNNEPVKTVPDLKKAFEGARAAGRKFALIKISRGGDEVFLTLPTGEEEKKK